MKELSLDRAWELCMEQWPWIIEEIEADMGSVSHLKAKWVKRNGFKCVMANCFFCEYAHQRDKQFYTKGDCKDCPGKKVDKNFDCENSEYHYTNDPIAFWHKIQEMNKIRTKENSMEIKITADGKEVELSAETMANIKAALEKKGPEPKTGEYGIHPEYGNCIFIDSIRPSKKKTFELSDGDFCSNAIVEDFISFGNIFDDLKRNAVDLEEFAVEYEGGFKFNGSLSESEGIHLLIHTGSSCYTLKKGIEIHQKLGQLIATAKRKAKK